MSEIYMRKKAFWKENNKNNNSNIGFYAAICLLILIIFLNFEMKDKNKKSLNEFKNRVKDSLRKIKNFNKNVYKIKIDVMSNDYKTINSHHFRDNEKQSKKRQIKHNLFDFLKCKIFEHDKYLEIFNKNYQLNLFLKCDNDSKEIETYFNFLLNKKGLDFKIEHEFTEDQKIFYDNQICLTSGKSNLALVSNKIPKCVEFKNLNIPNFIYNKPNVSTNNIYMNFHKFEIEQNKIHIYSISKHILSENHIQQYCKLNDDNSFYQNKNIYIHQEKNDKYIRICDIQNNKNSLLGNKLWLEIIWDPNIQNLVCYESVKYFN